MSSLLLLVFRNHFLVNTFRGKQSLSQRKISLLVFYSSLDSKYMNFKLFFTENRKIFMNRSVL